MCYEWINNLNLISCIQDEVQEAHFINYSGLQEAPQGILSAQFYTLNRL